ncbi:MAG: hypothetical protein HOV94_31525 [Saccharothrix sp.]|nr:hypothetical protein [Saccharothrix sp.]
MIDEPLELYERLRADSPSDCSAWIAVNVPEGVHLQVWGALNDFLKTDAVYALVDPDNRPKADFDRAVEFAIAAMESGRIPAFVGINWLGIYIATADRFGLIIEHPKLEPDNFSRRILENFPLARSRVLELSERLRVDAGWQKITDLGLDRDMWLAMRSVRLELEWAVPRTTDPQLAAAAKECLELVRRIDVAID